MGMATLRKKKFYAEHPFCIFCGGSKVIESIEHCPPRALFQNADWPEGFEFPACLSCNHGSSDQDLLVSLLARTGWVPREDGKDDGKVQGLIARADKRFPGIVNRMIRSPTQARKDNRRLGITPPPGETHQQQAINLPAEFNEAIRVFARKLSKGVFYKETGSIFPGDGTLYLNWFTNAQLIANDRYPAFEILNELGGKAPPVQRGNRYLNDQFSYRISISNEHDIFVLEATFTAAFGLVVFGSRNTGQLETIIQNLKDTREREGPFQVLQSPLGSAYGPTSICAPKTGPT